MSDSLFTLLGREIGRLLDPVVYALENPNALERLLASIGVTEQTGDLTGLTNTLTTVSRLVTQVNELAEQSSPSFGDIAALLELSENALTALQELKGAGEPASALENLGADLASFLVSNYLFNWHPLARDIAALLTLIDPADEGPPRPPIVQNSQLLRGSFFLERFRFDRIVDLLRDPVAALRSEYGETLATVDDANAIARKLFPRLQRVLLHLEVPSRFSLDVGDEAVLGDAAPLLEHAFIIYTEDQLAGAAAEAGLVFNLSSADQGDLGLVISPFGALTFEKQAGRWSVVLSLTAGVDVIAYGRHGLTLLASASAAEVSGSISGKLAAPTSGPAFILGAPSGSRLELGGAELRLDTSLSEARQLLALSADISSSALVLAPGDGDGFLSSVLPAEGMRANFDLGLAWSNERGLTLRGSAGMDATLPVGLKIGGVTVTAIHLSLQARDEAVRGEVSANFEVSLGPIRGAVERLGIETEVTFPENGGNLGVAQLELGFKPPTGVGLVVDAPGVTGGGFLRFDPDQGQYDGILELTLEDRIALKGIALIATRLPGGAKGFSLLIILTVEDFQAIPLGLGFKLTGLGGLLAIHRTFDEAVLRTGLKNHALDSILFPKDPIRNAPQILSTLNQVFPPAPGHHLFGPVVKLAWGTPTLITADLALVLELGARLRLLILAQISAVLPTQQNDLIRLQMDAVGVIDFDQGTAALDASLYDSRLLKKFVLTGDMALRLNWHGAPNFALAVGGLHPAFNPPPNFPKLARIALNLTAGNNPRLRCEAYYALTANSLQFGARAELYAEAAGFSLHGEIGYDVLIQVAPFLFLADFYAQVQIKRGSTNLLKVRVEGALAGPRPLHLKAKATFEVLWWDVSIRVDRTLVAGERPPLPAPVDVLPQLLAALGQPANWTGQLPAGQRQLVSLRSQPGAEADIRLHPLGTLAVKQSVVPLNLDIARFGATAPAGARRFTISSVSLAGQELPPPPVVKDFFAPAQFFDLSDDQKLSRPSFEQLPAGIAFGAGGFAFGTNAADWLAVDAIQFETIILGQEQDETRPSEPADLYRLSAARLDQQARFGAAGSSVLRRTGRAKYHTAAGKHQVVKEGWSIVAADDLTVQDAPGAEPGTPMSYSEAEQALDRLEKVAPARAGRAKILRFESEVQALSPLQAIADLRD